jgi:hypothetical protein
LLVFPRIGFLSRRLVFPQIAQIFPQIFAETHQRLSAGKSAQSAGKPLLREKILRKSAGNPLSQEKILHD